MTNKYDSPNYQQMSLDELVTRDPPFGGNFAKTIKTSFRLGFARLPQNPEDSYVLGYEQALRQNREALLQRQDLNPKVREYIKNELK